MVPPAAKKYADEMHAADVATFREQITGLTKQFDDHDKKDTARFDKVDNRLSRIELALATALGGMVVLGWLINHSANNILQLLGK